MEDLIDNLLWVASLQDIDHEICEIAEMAARELERKQNHPHSKESLSNTASPATSTGKD